MGDIKPAAAFEQLMNSEAEAGGPPPGRPYPFSGQPLGPENTPPGKAISGKQSGRDGIRAQLIRRQGGFLWGRGES